MSLGNRIRQRVIGGSARETSSGGGGVRPGVLTVALCALSTLVLLSSSLPVMAQDRVFDVVIQGGRVVDPASGFDGTANVGIRGERIAAVTKRDIQGERVIDASGLVVAPGFVDILAGGFSLEGNRYKAADGVTTILSMHGGPVDVSEWYAMRRDEGRLINYGTTVGHSALRRAVGIDDRDAAATPVQVGEMASLARRSIQEGAVGIGFGIQYVPGAHGDEVLELFRVAAEMGVPCHLHTRYLGPVPPRNDIQGVQEVIADAAATGASAQLAHMPAMAGHSERSMRTVLRLLEGAQAHGVDVTADAYPWRAGSTGLESAVFDAGWQERMQVDYEDIVILETGERLTAETFEEYRNDGEPTQILVYHVREETTEMALTHPHVMVGSDGGIRNGEGHPRGAGTYAKMLRKYVREEGRLTLLEAIHKMSYQPAQRLVEAAPVMRRKGRLTVGADADVVVFDLSTVTERATYQEPARYSEGFEWVLVNGQPVVAGGEVRTDVRPGQPVRGAP